MMYDYPNHMGILWGGSILFVLLNIVIWGLIIGVIVYAIRSIRPRSWSGRSDDMSRGALSILNERYAKGEITKEEYESRKRDILS